MKHILALVELLMHWGRQNQNNDLIESSTCDWYREVKPRWWGKEMKEELATQRRMGGGQV